jgi:hypothetical protein
MGRVRTRLSRVDRACAAVIGLVRSKVYVDVPGDDFPIMG